MKRISALLLTLLFLACGAMSLGAQTGPAFTLTLIHVNDTHSHFDPATVKLTLDLDGSLTSKAVYVQMGGFPAVADVIARLRAEDKNSLVIHAGDFFQGTLYFTKYMGDADVAFWNSVGLDVATLGNHEFDKGVPLLRDHFLTKINFPVVSTNVDFSKEPALSTIAPAPYLIKVVGGRKIGFVGATTTDTPSISSPGPTIRFLDPAVPLQKAIDILHRKGVSAVILISHLGYAEDLDLVGKLTGLSAVVGGHSHTLLGDWKAVGLGGMGPYPTVVKDKSGAAVPVVQSWEWAKIVGDITLDFDKSGHVISWKTKPVAVVGDSWFRVYDLPNPAGELKRVQFVKSAAGLEVDIYDGKSYQPASDELRTFYQADFDKLSAALAAQPALALSGGDPKAATLAAGYAAGVKQLQTQVATQAGEDMKRGLNTGPGPIIADSMRLKTGTQIAITNAGGVRTDVLQGPLTVAQVYEIIPFGDTLVTMKLTGAQVVSTFEDAVDFGLANYGSSFPQNPLTYVSGVTFTVSPSQAKGSRVTNVQVLQADGSYKPLDPSATYFVCVNNFIAAGGDKYATLKAGKDAIDTGFMDADVLLEYSKDLVLKNDETRITISQ
ncbi:MAG TPA: 5'-nucleotidase C-terminal domain-containing protein [Rectinemataceae bacterium]|nr:5'-nucleotidase C-terminal domain-containing protein [Rectinemataceae bacterium]